MSKFGKDNFEEGNKWRKRCKKHYNIANVITM